MYFGCAQYFQAADIIIVQGPKCKKKANSTSNGYKQEKGERSMLAPLSGYMPKKAAKGYALDIKS